MANRDEASLRPDSSGVHCADSLPIRRLLTSCWPRRTLASSEDEACLQGHIRSYGHRSGYTRMHYTNRFLLYEYSMYSQDKSRDKGDDVYRPVIIDLVQESKL